MDNGNTLSWIDYFYWGIHVMVLFAGLFSILWFWKRKKQSVKFPKRDISDCKRIVEILFIDDQPLDLVEQIENEGWKVHKLDDLDSFSNQYFVDSQIICLDIKGIGKILGYKSGLQLLEGIKKKYPDKKVIVYSSERRHDVFEKGIDYADVRIYKGDGLHAFLESIEDLAMAVSDWDSCINSLYKKYISPHGKLSLQEFEMIIKRSLDNNQKLDTTKLEKMLSIGADISTIVQAISSLFRT